LAHDFDGRPFGIVYAANIMLFEPAATLQNESERVRQRLRFAEPEIDVAALEGVLELRLDLSTTSEAADYGRDPSLQPLALPVPVATRSADGLRCRVLPGAPRAFCERTLDLYVDTWTLGAWCREQGDFTESVCRQVEEYFRSQSNVRSFVSFPLMQLRSQRPVGVLNIHRSKEGILRTSQTQGREAIQHFSALIGPFGATLLLLIGLLQQRERAASDAGC
jgi:hypothetical protein